MNAIPAQAFGVSVRACEAGWIELMLSAGEQEVLVCFSAVFDPLPALLAWLEAVALGTEDAAFVVDEESRLRTFSVTSLDATHDGADRVRFSLRNDAQDQSDPLAVDLERRVLVQALYGSITAFARSDRFDPREWDALQIDDEAPDEVWALGTGHGGTPLAGWRSELVERWLGMPQPL